MHEYKLWGLPVGALEYCASPVPGAGVISTDTTLSHDSTATAMQVATACFAAAVCPSAEDDESPGRSVYSTKSVTLTSYNTCRLNIGSWK